MRQSLAGAAVRGASAATIARQLLEAGDVEGLLAHNASVYGDAKMMADEDDDTDEVDDDDESDDSDDDDDDTDGDDEDKGDKKPDAKSRRIQELAAESKKHRLKARDYRKERDDALAELEKFKQGKVKPAVKSKDTGSESEDDEGDDASAELKAQNAKLQEQLVAQQLRSSFTELTTGSKPLAQFKNPKAAFKLLDLDDVEIVDGEVEGLEDAIKALVKSDPYLLVSKDEDDEDEDEVTERRRRRTTGQPTGGRKKANPDREKLVSKYPALRR